MKNGPERFLSYFKGLLTGQEKHAFEKEMMQDPFEEEAWEGLSRLPAGELESDLLSLQESLLERGRRRKPLVFPFLRYAAAAVLLLALGTTILLIRQSARKASSLQEIAQAGDPIVPKAKDQMPAGKDLDKNLAYIPEEQKQDAAVAGQHSVTPAAPAQTAENIPPAEEEQVMEYHSEMAVEAEAAPEEAVVTVYDIHSERNGNAMQKEVAGAISEKAEDMDMPGNSTSSRRKMKAGKPDISALAYTDESTPEKMVIRGTVVTSATGEPLPGVNVMIKGSSLGTVSDIQGNFTLEVPSGDEPVLTFSFVGYDTEEMVVSDGQEMNLAMNEDMISLDEIVVIGYGTEKKTELTGAVVRVTAEDLDHTAPASPVTVQPRPVCKLSEYKDYINTHIRYSALPVFDKAVITKLRFQIKASGEVGTIEVVKSAGEEFDREAIRLLREGPAWQPGTIGGQPSEMEVTLRIKFEPPENR